MSTAFLREQQRWYKLKDHAVQLSLVKAVSKGIRFPVVPAGRRSGKTERFKRFIAKEAMKSPNEKYVIAAPTYNQVKKIYWSDIKLLTFSSCHPKKPSESELIITLPNCSEIHLVGLDKPARFEGIPWTGGGVDEIADIKSSSLHENIMPALDTIDPSRPDYRPWLWFLGVPDGLNHFYDLAEMAKTDKDYGLFHWKSAEILPPDVIEAAKRRMSLREFRQEYEASFETASGRIYQDYSDENTTQEEIMPHELLHWSHDQNYTPLSSAISVIRDDKIYILDEIVLTSAVSRQSAEEFVERYKHHHNKHVIIYGDPAGKAGEKHGQMSSYKEIENVLFINRWSYERKVARKAPSIKDRQNGVRAKILNAAGERSLFVNPQKAEYAHKGLSTTQLKEGSTFLEDDKDKYQHITTAIGYMVSVMNKRTLGWANINV